MDSKKGAIEIEFNWIFIMVAGALIFMFFFSIIFWAKDSSDQSTSLKLSRSLDSIFTSSQVVRQTVNKIDIPFKSIEFSCDQYNGFVMDGSDIVHDTGSSIIFAPTFIEKSQLITWSLSWDVPFRVVNFLFVSSPSIRYIFISENDNEIFRYINESFPKGLNAEFYLGNPSSLTFENNKNSKVRFVYICDGCVPEKDNLIDFKKMGISDVTALVIDSRINSNFEDSSSLGFYRKSHPSDNNVRFIPQGVSEFFGKASLMGAIFSETSEDYDCNMGKAFLRLGMMADIYEKRTHELWGSSDTSCMTDYSDAEIEFGKMINSPTYTQLALSSNSIKDSNKELQKLSCPYLY